MISEHTLLENLGLIFCPIWILKAASQQKEIRYNSLCYSILNRSVRMIGIVEVASSCFISWLEGACISLSKLLVASGSKIINLQSPSCSDSTTFHKKRDKRSWMRTRLLLCVYTVTTLEDFENFQSRYKTLNWQLCGHQLFSLLQRSFMSYWENSWCSQKETRTKTSKFLINVAHMKPGSRGILGPDSKHLHNTGAC